MYDLEYLPSALEDMVDIVRYISDELKNPQAAYKLAEKFSASGESIAAFPYSNPAYIPVRALKHEYRKLLIENYTMFYWVDEDKETVVIARVIYSKRNYKLLIEQ